MKAQNLKQELEKKFLPGNCREVKPGQHKHQKQIPANRRREDCTAAAFESNISKPDHSQTQNETLQENLQEKEENEASVTPQSRGRCPSLDLVLLEVSFSKGVFPHHCHQVLPRKGLLGVSPL